MAITRFAINTASFTDLGDVVTTFSQLHGSEIMLNQQHGQEIAGGAIDPGWSMMEFADPKGGLRTFDIYKAWRYVGLTQGLACKAAVMRGRRRADRGTFNTGDVHATFTNARGWLGLQGVVARQRQAAEASLQYSAMYDGSAKPFVFSATGVYSGYTSPQVNTRFYLGPVYLGSSLLSDCQGVEINTGIDFSIIDGDGGVFPVDGIIKTRRPSIKLTTPNLDWLTSFAGLFMSTPTTITMFLRKGSTIDAGRVADGTAEHLKLVISSCAAKQGDIQAQGNDDYMHTVELFPNGTVTPTYDVAIAAP